MSLSVACYTAQAMDDRGMPSASRNHRYCRGQGGLVYHLPVEGFGTVTVRLCACGCHADQHRRLPSVPRPRAPRRQLVLPG